MNRRLRTSARLGMVDVETTPIRPGETPRTKLWGLSLEGEPYRRFDDTAGLTRFLRSRRADDLRLYNWHDFDVCQAISDGVVPEKMALRGGRVVRCEVEQVPWVNGYALFPTKLAKLMEAFGYAKKSLTAGDHPLGCECAACERALADRNESDCVEGLASLLKAGQAYEEAIGFDPVREDVTTAAKAAILAAERIAGPMPLYLDKREAYRGGRTEAFNLFDCGEVDCWDVNSSYPASFLDLPATDRLVKAMVAVEVAPEPRPFFQDGPRENGLLFPAGTFDTWFFESTYERYLSPHGGYRVCKVYEARPVDFSWLKSVVPLVERGYALKERGGALSYPAKILLNSLYGRMGLKAEATVSYLAPSVPDRPHVTYFRLPAGGYYVFHTVPREIKSGANYLFAAAITCNARGRLYDGMMRARRPTAYCDTDSVFVPKGTKGVPKGEGLGAWSKKGTGRLYVRTVKDYEFAGATKRKGGDRSTVWTVRLALARKAVRLVRRDRVLRYSKRRVLPDGTTLPLVVGR